MNCINCSVPDWESSDTKHGQMVLPHKIVQIDLIFASILQGSMIQMTRKLVYLHSLHRKAVKS